MSFHIKTLQLHDFRCHQNKRLSFGAGANIVVGKNASGKTSVVEAIYCLALGKSFKAASSAEMIRKGAEYAAARAEIANRDREDVLFVSIGATGKKIVLNNKPVSRLSEYLGYFKAVVFSPEDYRLIKGTPLDRRNFLDVNISQMAPEYLAALISYRKVLKQRNEVLKAMAASSSRGDEDLLDILSAQLAKEGRIIINGRKNFFAGINPLFTERVKQISEGKERGEMYYMVNTEGDRLEAAYSRKRNLELAAQTTLFGPHRDDFEMRLNGEVAAAFASQGQQKTLCLAAKLALTDLLDVGGSPLVVILDDVFSELDSARQNQILGAIDHRHQVFITATSVDGLAEGLLKRGTIINIEEEE